ncbi:hypothetical protein HN51_061491 [Arachis hypogaea]
MTYISSDFKYGKLYNFRYWTDKGLGWTRDGEVSEIDNALKHFEKNGEFFCFAGETSPSMSATYNLYRASQRNVRLMRYLINGSSQKI